MGFEKMKRAPNPSLYVDPLLQDKAGVIPETAFFMQEARGWRRYFKQRPAVNRLDKFILEHLVRDLQTIHEYWDTLPAMLTDKRNRASGWRMLAAAQSRVAFSRFWHEKRFKEEIEVDLAGETLKPTVATDLPTTDFSKGGLHARREFVENVDLAYPERKAPTWHEGQQVFVTVATPASATLEFHINYRKKYSHTIFPEEEFATIVPFLRREVWEECAPPPELGNAT